MQSSTLQHWSIESIAAPATSRRTLFRRGIGTAVSIAFLPKRSMALARPDLATTLRVAVETEIDTFDPAFSIGSRSAQIVIQNTFDQLTQYRIVTATASDGAPYRTVDTTAIEPMLCSSWTMDGADLVFTLPGGLVFANGDPLDAGVIV